MFRRSLRARILILTLSVEVVTLIAFGAVAYHRSRKQLLDSLDDQIRDEIDIVVNLMGPRVSGDPGSSGHQAISRFIGLQRHDLYQIMLSGGEVISKSTPLGTDILQVPQDIRTHLQSGKDEGFDLRWRGNAYRARLYLADDGAGPPPEAKAAGKSAPTGHQRYFVLLAKERKDLDGRLERLLRYIAAIGATVLLISTIAFWILVRWGLHPVTQLSREVESVAPQNLEYRVDSENLPRDLRALGISINGFIERLEKAFGHEKQFVADAAHELCTPIALLKSNIQSALLGSPDAVADRRSLEELLGDVERLEHLTNSLLALSEAESGEGAPAHREDIRLQAYLASLAAQFEHAARLQNVSLELESREDAVVRADRTTLDRVFANLLDNAIKHNRPGGKARLSIRRSGEGCEVWVADDGPGVPPEDAPHLFERFFRVDKSRSRERGGAGLGLAIAKSLCESQGAEIFYRPGERAGSIFVVRFPSVSEAPIA